MNLVELIVLVLPAYIANSTPVIFGGGTPMDFGRNFFDGKRVFGDGKTFRGFAAGLLAGVAASYVLAEYLGAYYAPFLATAFNKFAAGSILALGALVGDLAGSFVKRRLSLPRGHPSAFLDWLPFLFLALTFVFVYSPKLADKIGLLGFIFLTLLTIAAHIAFNRLGYLFGLKKVPW